MGHSKIYKLNIETQANSSTPRIQQCCATCKSSSPLHAKHTKQEPCVFSKSPSPHGRVEGEFAYGCSPNQSWMNISWSRNHLSMNLAKLYPRNMKKKKKSWKMASLHKESNVFMETLQRNFHLNILIKIYCRNNAVLHCLIFFKICPSRGHIWNIPNLSS